MLEHALSTETGEKFFLKQFDKKISDSKSKMEQNYNAKLEEAIKLKETEWIEKHKEKKEKSPLELKLEEQAKELSTMKTELKRKEILGVVNNDIPESLRPYAEKLIDPNWGTEDAKAFAEQFKTNIDTLITTEAEKRLSGNRNDIGNPSPKPQGGSKYAQMDAKALASLPDDEYKLAIQELTNNKNGD
jgi:hypothetical protein